MAENRNRSSFRRHFGEKKRFFRFFWGFLVRKMRPKKTKSEKRNYIVTFYLLIEFTEFWHDDRGARGPQNVEKNRESEILVTRLNNF